MILFDTHVLLWQEGGDRRLGPQALSAFESALQEGVGAVSAMSFWEVGMLIQKRRVVLSLDLGDWRRDMLERGLLEIPVDGVISARAGLLEDVHGDPADRIIISTAMEGHQLVTADQRILDWPGQLSKLDART